MEKIILTRKVIDSQATGKKIQDLRKLQKYSVHFIQMVFGFEYPQAVYAWEQGKNIPSIDNLLILSGLFNVPIEELLVTKEIPIEIEKSA